MKMGIVITGLLAIGLACDVSYAGGEVVGGPLPPCFSVSSRAASKLALAVSPIDTFTGSNNFLRIPQEDVVHTSKDELQIWDIFRTNDRTHETRVYRVITNINTCDLLQVTVLKPDQL